MWATCADIEAATATHSRIKTMMITLEREEEGYHLRVRYDGGVAGPMVNRSVLRSHTRTSCIEYVNGDSPLICVNKRGFWVIENLVHCNYAPEGLLKYMENTLEYSWDGAC